MATNDGSLNELAARVRAKYPGSYADLTDADLTKRILAKHPQYSDLATTVPIPPGATIGEPSKTVPIPSGAMIGHPDEGLQTNEDGSFVIRPRDGESFSDTMKRAAGMAKTVTPELMDKQTSKGLRDAPKVLAAAPVIGAGGAALLAGPGEVVAGGKAALAGLLPPAIKGVQAVGTWAQANPVKAYLVYQALKDLVGAGKLKYIKGVPTGE